MENRTRALTTALLATGLVLACQDSNPTAIDPIDPGIQLKKGGGGGNNDPVPITVASMGGIAAAAQSGTLDVESSRSLAFTAGDFTACRADPADPGCFFAGLALSSIVEVGSCVADNQAAMDTVLQLLDDPTQGRFYFNAAINIRTNPSDRNNQIKLFWDDDVQGRRVDLLVTTDKQEFPNNKLTVARATMGDIEEFTFTDGSIWFPGGGIGSVTCPFSPTGSITVTIDRTP